MPNWCSNLLTLREGNAEDEERFREMMGGLFTLNKFLPMPEELEGIHSGAANIDGEMVSIWREVGAPPEHKLVKISKEEEERMQREYFATNAYDWHTIHWGTKWDVGAEVIETDDGFEMHFDSAWGPPSAAIRELSALFESFVCTLEYCEPGSGFAGFEVYEEGNQSADHYCEDLEEARHLTEWLRDQLEWLDDEKTDCELVVQEIDNVEAGRTTVEDDQ